MKLEVTHNPTDSTVLIHVPELTIIDAGQPRLFRRPLARRRFSRVFPLPTDQPQLFVLLRVTESYWRIDRELWEVPEGAKLLPTSIKFDLPVIQMS